MATLEGRGSFLLDSGNRLGDCEYRLVETSEGVAWRGTITFLSLEWTPRLGGGFLLELDNGKRLRCELWKLKDPKYIGRPHSYEARCWLETK